MVYGGASIGTLHLAEKLDPELFECTIIHGFQSENEGNLLQGRGNSAVQFIAVPEMVREIDIVKDFKTLLKLVSIFKKNRYDIVHTHGSKAGVIGRVAAAVARTPAVLYTVHGWGLKAGNPLTRGLFRFIEKLVASFTTILLFQTKSDMDEAALYDIGNAKKYVYIGNGINLGAFRNINQIKVNKVHSELKIGSRHVVGTIGRVSAQKNPEGFIKIAQSVLKKRNDVMFFFIGGGEMLDLMRAKIKALKLEDRIIFTGMKSNIPEILANFDVFILPSLWEGMPRSLIEAMTMSKPVIVYNISGIHEIVVDGKNGFIIPLNDTNKFADSILHLIDNPSIAQTMGQFGLIKAKEYDYSFVVEKIGNLYRKLFQSEI